jgi:transcriptional regulator with XRE-family HTH domain
VKKAIGTRIRKLRVSKEYTQDNMAAELEITAGAYAKIERGETDPSATRLIQIAEILGVDVIYFFQESSSELQLLDQHARYGNASQQDIEQLSTQIGLLKKEIEKIKAELALIRKPKGKK